MLISKHAHNHRKSPKSQGILKRDGSVYSYITDIPRSPSLGNQAFTMSQNVLVLGWFSTSVAVNMFTTVSFTANTIDQWTDLISVFDQYRIDAVEVFITTQPSNSNVSNTGRLITVIDYDDATALATLGAAEDYTTAITSSCQSNQYRHFVPRMALGAYGGATFTSYANVQPQWLDTNSGGVVHYGLKVAASPTSQVMIFDLQIRFKISFRMVR